MRETSSPKAKAGGSVWCYVSAAVHTEAGNSREQSAGMLWVNTVKQNVVHTVRVLEERENMEEEEEEEEMEWWQLKATGKKRQMERLWSK